MFENNGNVSSTKKEIKILEFFFTYAILNYEIRQTLILRIKSLNEDISNL